MATRKRPMKRRRAVTPKAKQRKSLDDLHRIAVMVAHGAFVIPTGTGYGWLGACLRCKNRRWLQVSHIAPKGQYPGVRHDPENAFALCYHCHIHWWHKNPFEAHEFCMQQLGKEKYDELFRRAKAGRYLTGHDNTVKYLLDFAQRYASLDTVYRLWGIRMEGSNDGE